MSHALASAWGVRGRRVEARQMYEWAMVAACVEQDQAEQQWCEHALAVLAGLQGKMEEARQGYKRALSLTERLGSLNRKGAELQSLGEVDRQTGEYERGRALLEQSLASFAQT